jgi:phosphinothricin acetyltransferase
MNLVHCTHERHAAAILDIFNEAILNSTVLWEYHPRTAAFMVDWFASKARGRFPVLGAEDDAGRLLGFASYGSFRAWPAYKYTVEHSVYVHHEHRGRGVGRMLLGALIEAARAQDVHVLVGGIEAANLPSIALHEAFGFTHAGTVREAGYKFGRWLDLAFYQRVLDTPVAPKDG